MLLLGEPGGGKSCLIKNIVIHQRPHFDKVYVIHEDHSSDPKAPGTSEYDDMDATAIMNEVPDLAYWNSELAQDDPEGPPVKRLCILDDLEMKGTDRLKNLQTLFRYISSHKGISLCLAHQNFFGLEPVIRKNANIFVVWKPRDREELARIENRVGLEKGMLRSIFTQFWGRRHDSICVDCTPDTPYPLRLNISIPIVSAEDDD
jgi:hypothetical protein